MPIISVLGCTLFGLLASAPLASAHTWIEQMMVIGSNGTLMGQPGYARGNVLRSSPGFSDPTMVNLIPPDGRTINEILPTDLMCMSSQTSAVQTDGSPRLQAAAGDGISLRYQENGHVTLPQNQPGKPQNRGTVYVYGTTTPSPTDSFLAIHRVWTPDGTGGDGRGKLLSTQNFDDGQCYQVNGGTISQQRQQQFSHPPDSLMGADLWCQQDLQVPADAPSGQPYTLYWVWDWPTLPGTAGFPDGKQEIYTTCMDVDIISNAGDATSEAQISYAQGQPLDNAAVAAEVTDIANPTAVTGQTIPFSTGVPANFTAQNGSLWSNYSSSLTYTTTGSTIAFSASATGPVDGDANGAGGSAATTTDTGVPGFMSVHVGSTAGPGIETQTFSVMPISVGANGESSPPAASVPILPKSAAPSGSNIPTGPQVTAAPNAAGNAQVATFTEYESVTQTVLQTVFLTMYTKRDAGESISTAPASAGDGYPHSPPWKHPHNGTHPFPPWQHPGNHTRPVPDHFPKTFRPGGPPVWSNGTWPTGSGWPHVGPTGWPKQNGGSSSSTGYDGDYGTANGMTTTIEQTTIFIPSTVSLTTYVPSPTGDAAALSVVPVSLSSSPTSTTVTNEQTTVTVTGTMTMTTYLPSAMSPTASAAAATSSEITPVLVWGPTTMRTSTLTSESYSSSLTVTVTATIYPNSTSLPSSHTSNPSPSSTTPTSTASLTFTVSPIPDPIATPSPTTSTDHAAFRLRARNPFVMLGWMSESAPPTTTKSS